MTSLSDLPTRDTGTGEFWVGPTKTGGVDLNPLLDEMLTVRGATAAAVVTTDGEVVAGRSVDRALLERTVDIITSALAAGLALGELLDADGTSDETALEQVSLMFGEGPIVLRPLHASQRVLVLALASESDLGRARLALRSRLAKLADATFTS